MLNHEVSYNYDENNYDEDIKYDENNDFDRDTENDEYDEEGNSSEDYMKKVKLSKVNFYAVIRRNNKLLTTDELNDLMKLTKSRNKKVALKAKGDIIKHNIGLVIKVARFYMKSNVPFDDLMQEGMIGLMEAIDKYDFDKAKQSRFSTYATWWIRKNISEVVINQSKNIRVPYNLMWSVIRIYNYEKEYAKNHLKQASFEHIAKKFKIPVKDVVEIKRIMKLVKTISIEEYTDYDKTRLIGDTIEGDFYEQPENAYDRTELSLKINEAFDMLLNDKEIYILEHFFGLNGKDVMTVQEMGDEFKVSKVRISQIKSKAIKKLLKSCEETNLEEFVS